MRAARSSSFWYRKNAASKYPARSSAARRIPAPHPMNVGTSAPGSTRCQGHLASHHPGGPSIRQAATPSPGSRRNASTSAPSAPGSGYESSSSNTRISPRAARSPALRPSIPTFAGSANTRTSGNRARTIPALPSVEPLSTTTISPRAKSPSPRRDDTSRHTCSSVRSRSLRRFQLRTTAESSGSPGRIGLLRAAREDPVDDLDALHERVVAVADLVPPPAEPAARVDPARLQETVHLAQQRVTAEERYRVRVAHPLGPQGHDPVPPEEPEVLETGHRVLDRGPPVERPVGRERDLHEQRVRPGPRHDERRVVGQERHAVERVLRLGEVHPVPRAGALPAHPEADREQAVAQEATAGVPDGRRHAAVEQAQEQRKRQRRDEVLVADLVPVAKRHDAPVHVHARGDAAEVEPGGIQGGGDRGREPPESALERVREDVIGPPLALLAEDQAAQDLPQVDRGDALADPAVVHRLQRVRPDLLVVGEHELPGDAPAEGRFDPLAKVGRPAPAVGGGLEQPAQALVRERRRKLEEVLLVRIPHPVAADP